MPNRMEEAMGRSLKSRTLLPGCWHVSCSGFTVSVTRNALFLPAPPLVPSSKSDDADKRLCHPWSDLSDRIHDTFLNPKEYNGILMLATVEEAW